MQNCGEHAFVGQILERIWQEASVEACDALALHDLLRHGKRAQAGRALQLNLAPATGKHRTQECSRAEDCVSR